MQTGSKTAQITKAGILRKLRAISKAAGQTGMTGKIELHFSGIHPEQWDRLLASLTEFPRWQHYVQLGERLTVALLD